MEHDVRRSIARLAAAVLTADGRITSHERAALVRLEQLALGSLSALVEEEVARSNIEPIAIADACAALAKLGPHAAAVILAALTEVAGSDRELAPRELELLREVGTRLGLREPELLHVINSTLRSAAVGFTAAPPTVPLGDGQTAAPTAAREREPAVSNNFTPEVAHAYGVLGVPYGSDMATVDAAYLAMIERYNPVKVSELGADFVALAVRRLARATTAFETVRAAQRAVTNAALHANWQGPAQPS